MTYAGILLTFAAVHFLAAASPGPNLIIVSSQASGISRKAGLLAGLGVVLGTLTWASITALGLGAVLVKFPTLYAAVQYAGAAYLVWLGLRMIFDGIRNRYRGIEAAVPRARSARSIVLAGYLVNMTNPKTIVYWTSLFAVIVPPDSPVWLFVAAALTAAAVSASWWALVALVFSTGTVRRRFVQARRYLDLVMGGALVFLGIRLASSR
jgi:threonine/homoserine/homoserine lactone efflux protein